jgi:hypothetical protein
LRDREQIREEAKAAREYAAVIKKAEQEEKLLVQIMAQAKVEIVKATVDEESKLEKQL